MTTYNTGNPLGSTSPKDLFDNAQNLDVAINSRTSRTWVDRKGILRRTNWGMEQDFNDFLAASGFVDLGPYAAGLILSSYNQTFTRSGLVYRAAPSTILPYTTTGNWATEESKFTIAGDNTLRQDLALPTGSNLVGFKYSGAGATLRTIEQVIKSSGTLDVRGFGAIGNGIADDTAAINAAAAAAFTSGAMLLFPSGGVFNTTGEIQIKVALQGYGATLVNISATEKTDKFANATIILSSVGASVSGLRVVCNHKTSGISCKSQVACTIRDVQIIDPIMAGICFEDVESCVVTNSFVQDVRCNLTAFTEADGVYSKNCDSFIVQDFRCVGFQRAGVYTEQTVDGAKTSKIVGVQVQGGNYPHAAPMTGYMAGVFVSSVASLLLDGIAVSNMPDSNQPYGGNVVGIALSSGDMPYSPVYVIRNIQIRGDSVGGNLYAGMVMIGLTDSKLSIIVDTVEVSKAKYGMLIYSLLTSVTITNFVGRNMFYNSKTDTGLLYIAAEGTFLDISAVHDLFPVRTGTGSQTASIRVDFTGSVAIHDISSPVSLHCEKATYLNIDNCSSIYFREPSYPFISADNLNASSSSFIADPSSSKSFMDSGKNYSFTGCSISGFSSNNQTPLNLRLNGCNITNTPIVIAEKHTNISNNSLYMTVSGSPIVFPNNILAESVCSITNNIINMIDATYPISRIASYSPQNYTILGVQWTGGLSDITNFDVAKGISANNRKTT